jgi:hypothetical protein
MEKEEESTLQGGRKEPGRMASSPQSARKGAARMSNLKLMVNALKSLLPGEINRGERERLVGVLEGVPEEFSIFLFRSESRLALRGIYLLRQGALVRAWGSGPERLEEGEVRAFYRYDSGGREFREVAGCRHLSLAVNGVVAY